MLLLGGTLFSNLSFSQQHIVEMESQSTEDGYDIFAVNSGYCSYMLKFDFNLLVNLSGAPSHGREIEAPRGKTKVFSLKVIKKGSPTNFNYTYSYRQGRVVRKYNEDFTYLLPLQSGKPTKTYPLDYIGDKYGSMEEKDKPINFYSISFTTESNDTICAARGGIVCKIESDIPESGENYRFRAKVNLIEIFHKDGTLATYRVFKPDGILVKLGQKVDAGEPIGLAGGANYEIGSHIRFAVFYAHKDGRYAYIKPKFCTKENGNDSLKLGEIYTANHAETVLTQEMSKRQIKKRKKLKGSK